MYRLTTHSAIAQLPREHWNRLAGDDAPFFRHEFLDAMERTGGVGEDLGWLPHHLALRDAQGEIQAVAPCYLKTNSYGEFVFDWVWADAYRRHGRAYYPKLVVASPYTPATGPRMLAGDRPRSPALLQSFAAAATRMAEDSGWSSMHWLFTGEDETAVLEQQGLLRRSGCQFHWHNRGYRSFEDFLGAFNAAKRKMVKRERRRVEEAGVRLRQVPGDEATEGEWAIFHQLYRDTFDKRGGYATLSLEFFLTIAQTMGEQLLLVFAEQGPHVVAAAFSLVGARSLYGRHWGCFRDFHSLHFEACYYQGLEFCIEQGLERFEPGAQGEHKVSRGFLPTPTWSAHWIGDPLLRDAINRFLHLESDGMADYLTEMRGRSPFRATPDDAAPVWAMADDRAA